MNNEFNSEMKDKTISEEKSMKNSERKITSAPSHIDEETEDILRQKSTQARFTMDEDEESADGFTLDDFLNDDVPLEQTEEEILESDLFDFEDVKPEKKIKKKLISLKKNSNKSEKKPKPKVEEDSQENTIEFNEDDIDEFEYEDDIDEFEYEDTDTNKHKLINPLNLISNNNTKMLVLILSAILLFSLIIVGGIYLFKNITEKPPTEIQNKPLDEFNIPIDTIEYSSENETVRQGVIKRILGNKVVIAPDDDFEDIIYYIKDMDSLDEITSGAHIEYHYVIENFISYITKMVNVNTGVVEYKGLMTLNVKMEDKDIKFSFNENLDHIVRNIKIKDNIEFIYEETTKDKIITSIIRINGADSETVQLGEYYGQDETINNNITGTEGYLFDKEDFYEEYLIIDNRYSGNDYSDLLESRVKDGTVDFFNAFEDPIWIRVAWRVTDIMPVVPPIENVNIKLVSPSGEEISYANIEKHGRMWIDGNIVNFAIKNPEIGEWQMVQDKQYGAMLGELKMHIMKLSGFINIDKFGANLINRNELELIWNIGGIPDNGMEIEVFLTNDKFSLKVLSLSSKQEQVHIIDRKIVNISTLPRGKYNVLVRVKDIDIATRETNKDIAENTLQVTAETIIDEKNVGMVILQ